MGVVLQLKCWNKWLHCTFLQTTDMLKQCVPSWCNSMLVLQWQHCTYILVTFRHKKRLVRVSIEMPIESWFQVLVIANTAWDGLSSLQKYPVFVASYMTGNAPEDALKISSCITLTNVETVLNCGHWLGSLLARNSTTVPLRCDRQVINMTWHIW